MPLNIESFSIGFELEYDSPPVDEAMEVMGDEFGTIKGDSSVEQGFELESKVYQRELFLSNNFHTSQWIDMFNKLHLLRVVSSEIAGHHIHIENKALYANDWNAIARLLSINKLVSKKLAGREYNFSKVRSVSEFAFQCGGRAFIHNDTYHGDGVHGTTAEFRFFQTADNVHTFLKNMQLVISLCDFVRIYPNDTDYNNESTIHAWIDFIINNKDIYFDLFVFLEHYNFLKNLFLNEETSLTISEFVTYESGMRLKKLAAYLQRFSPYDGYIRREDLRDALAINRMIEKHKAPVTYKAVEDILKFCYANDKYFIKVEAPKAPSVSVAQTSIVYPDVETMNMST